MKRYHQNLSNEVMVFRTWILNEPNLTEADFKWLKGLGIALRIDSETHELSASNGTAWKYNGKTFITLDTVTDKQRNMLMLKYGNKLILIQEDIVLPGTMSTCTLEGINYE